ncbi:Alkaline phosphatase synthesis sensor protein PhoR [compost metagenome]
MRRNRIGLKLGLIILSVFIAVLTSSGWAVNRMFTNFYYTEMRTEVDELTTHFATMAQQTDISTDQMLLKLADFSDVNIFYVDAQGKIVAQSGENAVTDSSFVRQEDVRTMFSGQMVAFEYEDADGSRYFVAGQPIRSKMSATINSAIYVLSSTKPMEKSISAVRQLLILSGIGAFLLAVGITWVAAQIFSRPLLQMQKATRKIAAGHLETRLHITSNDELGALAEAINNLAKDLQRYQDNRQQFFANISHELRTPITYLEGYTRVVRDRLYETEEEKERYLNIIHQEAGRLQHMVNDLFELAKMEEGKISLSMEWIDLTEITVSAVRKIQLKVNEKGLQLHTHLEDNIPLIYGDGLRMEQVILNLLENAVRYTEAGEVKVNLTKDSSFVYLSVEDTGIGIPQEELPYVFDRFYRVEKSRSRQYGGTGLGLPIAKKFLELHGGELKAVSQVGVGTSFVMKLKYDAEQGEAE